MIQILILALVIAGVVGLDQLTKVLAVTYLEPRGEVPLWNGVLHLNFVRNEGAAFGMFSNHRWVFMVFSTIAIVGLSVYLFRFCKEKMWAKVSLAIIIGGGIGNMIDRFSTGSVVDFIYFALIDFPVFNVADSFVCIGAGLLAVYLIRMAIEEEKQEKETKLTGEEAEKAPQDETDNAGESTDDAGK